VLSSFPAPRPAQGLAVHSWLGPWLSSGGPRGKTCDLLLLQPHPPGPGRQVLRALPQQLQLQGANTLSKAEQAEQSWLQAVCYSCLWLTPPV
jgi:hypothetical protein